MLSKTEICFVQPYRFFPMLPDIIICHTLRVGTVALIDTDNERYVKSVRIIRICQGIQQPEKRLRPVICYYHYCYLIHHLLPLSFYDPKLFKNASTSSNRPSFVIRLRSSSFISHHLALLSPSVCSSVNLLLIFFAGTPA